MGKRKKPEFEFDGVIYQFSDLTVGQMEIISEILHESRKKLFEEMAGEENNLMQIARLTANIANIVADIKRQRKYARFIATCMVQKGQKFDEDKLPELEQKFKNLPEKYGEEVIRFFFTGEEFVRLLIPSFLLGKTPSREKSIPSEG